MSAALPLPTSTERQSATFGTASLVLAGFTVVVPVVVMALFVAKADQEPHEGWGWLAGLAILAVGGIIALLAAGFTGLVGSIAGAVALARGERGVWRAVVGLLVNAPVFLFVAYLALMVWTNRGG